MLKDMLPQNNEEIKNDTQEYSFSTGTASDYTKLLGVIQEPKQQYEREIIDDDTEVDNDTRDISVRQTIANKSNESTAKFIVSSTDRLITFVGNLILGDIDDVDISADADEKQEMQEAWAAVFPDPTKQLPPWLMALIIMVFIYGSKIQMAVRYKKAQEKIESDAITINQQNAELEAYKKIIQEMKEKDGNS